MFQFNLLSGSNTKLTENLISTSFAVSRHLTSVHQGLSSQNLLSFNGVTSTPTRKCVKVGASLTRHEFVQVLFLILLLLEIICTLKYKVNYNTLERRCGLVERGGEARYF